MDYFKINGISYEVVVLGIEESFNILYSENTGRTMGEGAPMTLDALGTFFGHRVRIKRRKGYEEQYDALFDTISEPIVVEEEEDALLFEVAHGQSTIAYRGYVSNATRSVVRIDAEKNEIYWGEMTLNIVPIKAQRLP